MAESQRRTFHDFTLKAVTIDWETGAVAFELLGPHGSEKLNAVGVRHLSLPRRQPWGPSVLVNKLTTEVLEDNGLAHVHLEMQSGDVIELVCERVD